MLMSTTALAARLDDPNLRIADVRWYLGQPDRARAEYSAGHIPGAVFVDLETDLRSPGDGGGRHPLPDPTAFARRMGDLGFGTRHTIVVYDDLGGATAARLWWMLDNLGHPDTAVLDGGLKAWLAEDRPTSTEPAAHRPTTLELASAWHDVSGREALRDRLGEVVLLDARAGERYRGELEPIDPIAGHIPTARSVPTGGNLGADGRFLAPERLRERFAGLADSDPGTVVTSCGSGVTACHTALAMRLAGLPDPILYPGSFSDWSTAGLPVVTGPEPGDPPRS